MELKVSLEIINIDHHQENYSSIMLKALQGEFAKTGALNLIGRRNNHKFNLQIQSAFKNIKLLHKHWGNIKMYK